MNLQKMSKQQLKMQMESNAHTIHSIEIGLKNWRNAMLNCHVETGEMSLLEFNEKWDAARKIENARIAEIEKENYEIRELLVAGN